MSIHLDKNSQLNLANVIYSTKEKVLAYSSKKVLIFQRY